MIVTSPAFTNNGNIPVKHTGFGEDKSPEFQISEVPENTVSFAIILDDLDVPWVKNCYRAPKQPFFIKKEHRYVFYFYALDTFLEISENSNKQTLQTAMQGHILAETQIWGRFKRHFYG